MIKQPLFGEDSSPHITSMLISSIVTLICWIIFCILCFFVKFKPQTPQYKEVQIVLSSTPVVEKESSTEEAAASAQVFEENLESSQSERLPEPVEGLVEEVPEIPNPVETPVAVAKVEAPKETPAPAKTQTKTQTTTKTQPAKTTTTQPAKTTTTQPAKTTDPSKKVNFDDYQYATDMEDAINNQFNKTNTQKQFRDDLFTDNENTVDENTVKDNNKVLTQSGASGNAGSVDGKTSQGVKSSDKKNDPSQHDNVSDDTTEALRNIVNATSYKKQTGNVESTVMAETTKTNGYVNMKLSDGTTRALIEPLTPAITLSPEAAKAVENTVTVRIKFYVLSVGNVKSKIEILFQNNDNSAESLLPAIVRNEIYDQLKKWIFEPGTSEAFAIFELTIKKN